MDGGVVTAMTARGIRVRALLPAMAAAMVLAPAAPPQAQSPAAENRAISLLRAGDSRFDASLDADFSGLRDVPGFPQIAPLAAILRNESAHGVLAYVVNWTFAKAGGAASSASLQVIQEPSAEWALSGQKVILQPRETQLVSPFFNWNAARFPAMLRQGLIKLSFQVDLDNPLLAETAGAREIRASLDGVVFDDGFLAGPDTLKLFDRFQAEQQAEQDEAQWVVEQLSGGAGELRLATSLREQIAKVRQAADARSPSLYDAALLGQAAQFIDDLRSKGLEAVQDRARRMAAAKLLPLRR